MAWINIPASKSLVDEFNAAFPGRDKASDGTIGDGEHSQTSSDHNPDETGRTPYEDNDDTNEVHARDVDDDLRKAGWSMQRVVDLIVARCRSGAEKRIRYIIYNRRIISASWGWGSWHAYYGPSPHTEHAHFSFFYGSGNGVGNPENITSPWGILAAVNAGEDWFDMATPSELREAMRDVIDGKFATDKTPFVGRAGDRLTEAGWAALSRDEKIDRLFEGVIGSLPIELTADGLGVLSRLVRTEKKVDDLAGICGRILAALGTETAPPPAG